MPAEATVKRCRGCSVDFRPQHHATAYCSGECKRLADRVCNQRWREKNREHIAAKSREYTAANQERYSEYAYKRRYGMTYADVARLHSQQGGLCAICRKEILLVGPKGRDKAVVDHCHGSGSVRGLLCTPCNLMIGYAADEPSRLASAIKYLESAA